MDEPQLGESAKENATTKATSNESKSQDCSEKNAIGKGIENPPQPQQQSRPGNEHRHNTRTFYGHKQQFASQPHYQPPRNGQSIWSAKDKRHDFADKRVRSQTHNQSTSNSTKGWQSSEKPGQIDQKTRSLSTTTSNQPPADGGDGAGKMDKRGGGRSQRHRKSATDLRTSSNNSISNGESFDVDEMDLDEPFSESEDEYAAARRRAALKPCLAIPRGRIRSLSGTIPPVGYSPHWGGPTMCLSCLQFFQLPDMTADFSAHLLAEHKIVIDGIDIIVDLKRYVEHWRQQLTKQSIDQIFPKVVPKEGDELHGKVDYYFNMSEHVKEDYALRQRLAMRRLEEALACQQREREDCTFSMQCVFCRYTARGNRAKIIHHLYTIHHLNLGSPDNLVFVTEYIEHLREKINRNECIYCEKTFSDRNTLMEHMRKKNHKEVNPKNNYYDKFYIINYLELGKRWLDVLAEDFEDTMPTFVDSDEEEEEESWHEWQEDNTGEEDILAVCLFCDHGAETLDAVVKHMDENHKFNLVEHIRDQKMGTYERMKFLNFIRKRTFNTRSVPATENKFADIPEREEWDKEENLVPMFGNDHLLWMLESWFLEQEGVEEKPKPKETDEAAAAGKPKEKAVELLTLVEDSKRNTVPGVTAEDLPDLTDSCLANSELQESLR